MIEKIRYPFGEYDGEVINEKPNGYGTMRFNSGERHEGRFSDGLLDGSGKIFFVNGSILEGEFCRGVISRGKLSYASGIIFNGTFENKNPREGVMLYPNGEKFEGYVDFSRNYKKGTHFFADGTRYVGEFKEGLRHGRGIEYQSDITYDGHFENDKREGVFDVISADSRTRATYHDDILDGYYYSETNGETYEGSFSRGKEDGRWKLTKNGKVYFRTYSHGKLIETTENVVLPMGNIKDISSHETVSAPKAEKVSAAPTVYTVKFDVSRDAVFDGADQGTFDALEARIKADLSLKEGLLSIEKYVKDNFESCKLYTDWQSENTRLIDVMAKLTNRHFKLFPNGDSMFGYKALSSKPHNGYYRSKGGDIYVGEFIKDKLNGIGIHSKDNKDKIVDLYLGEYKDGKEHGKGVRFLKDSKIFGSYADGKYEGICKIEYKDRRTYMGELKAMNPDGRGVMTMSDGRQFIGRFVGGRLQGSYICVHKNKEFEIGSLGSDGKLDGLYTKYYADGSLMCAYTYQSGVMSGPAKQLLTSGKHRYTIYYLGEEATSYKNDEFEFYGKLDSDGYAMNGKVKLPDGRIYTGKFEKGKLTGKDSQIIFPNGDSFSGEVKNGEPVSGDMVYKKPYRDLFTKYTGSFKDGVPSSWGRFYYAASDMWCEGPIINGLPNGYGTLHANGKDTKYHFVNGFI